MNTGLQITNIHKSFGKTKALDGISFDVVQGEIVAVLGPSGCGKSTLLSIIGGLESADQGEMRWNGEPLAGMPPHKRSFGLMFQDFALFPHQNVFENVAFGLRMAQMPRLEVQERVSQVLDLVGLPGFKQRDVNTLSGGEGQRVALARSLAPNPRLLMLDEPLGSLDRTLRERLVFELKEILRSTKQTTIYVTHDQEEAFIMADRVVVMNTGKVEQVDTPQEIYHRPASVFVARFLGMENLFPGEIRQGEGGRVLKTPIGTFPAREEWHGPVTVLLHPDAVKLFEEGLHKLPGIVIGTSFRGNTCRATMSVKNTVDVSETLLIFDFLSYVCLPDPGEPVNLGFDPAEAIQIFPKGTIL